MNTLNIVLFALGLFGFLPLVIIIYKRKRAKNILKTGLQAKARVYSISAASKPAIDIVFYSFYAANHAELFTGKLTTSRGKHQINDVLSIIYRKTQNETVWKAPGNQAE